MSDVGVIHFCNMNFHAKYKDFVHIVIISSESKSSGITPEVENLEFIVTLVEHGEF